MSNLLSATIVADDCMTADAYATACMVMGVERSRLLLEQSDDVAVMLMYVDDEGRLAIWENTLFGKMRE